tara:strand:+ start:75 stop:809 length:735 start_codon:yes stop_codon:yes gene_type:complete
MKTFKGFGGKLAPQVLNSFTPDECATITADVLRHKDVWTDRGMMWTIGASAYIDTAEDYLANVDDENAFLLTHFTPVIAKVIKDIGLAAKRSAGPLENPDGHGSGGLPGFHIINHRSNSRSGVFHVDLAYQRVYWPGPFLHPFSFTTLIATPECGSGLWHWDDIDPQEAVAIILETRNDSRTAFETPEKGRSLLTYEVGKTYVHSGRVPHAIADMGDILPDEYRITMQGHGAYLPEDDALVLYF